MTSKRRLTPVPAKAAFILTKRDVWMPESLLLKKSWKRNRVIPKSLWSAPKKAQINIEQITTELAQERGQVQKLENSRMLLERQNKELKAKLSEVETSQRAKAKATIAALESKIANLEEQLAAETAERMAQAKINRKAEKKMKENLLLLEDERRHADQYKEQPEKAARRKTQRELEDLIAENESKEREITNLKNKLRRGIGGSVQSGSAGADAESLQDESSLDGEENDK